jgi:hypothetical protein
LELHATSFVINISFLHFSTTMLAQSDREA